MNAIVQKSGQLFSLRQYVKAIWWLFIPAFLLISIKFNMAYGIIFLFAMFIFIKFAWKNWFLPVLFLLYVALIPAEHWGEVFNIFPFYFYDKTIYIIIILSLCVVFYSTSFIKRTEVKAVVADNYLNIIIYAYIYYAIFAIVRGMAFGNNSANLLIEFSQLFMFLGFFIWYYVLYNKNIMRWLLYIVILSTFVSLEFGYLISRAFTNILDFVIFRPITNHAYIGVVGLPLTLGLFHIKKKMLWRISLSILGFIQILLIILSQKRMLWVELIFLFMLFYFLYINRYGITFNRIFKSILLYAIYFMFLFGLLYFSASLFNVDINIILGRWQGVGNLSDNSLLMRFFDINRALKILHGNFLLGMGAGSELRSAGTGSSFRFIDNSYVIALFKGGIIQLILLCAVYFTALQRSYRIYKRAEHVELRIIGASLFTAIAGIMFSGMTEVSMIYFAHVYIWMMVFAITIILYERYIIKRNRINNVYECDTENWERL